METKNKIILILITILIVLSLGIYLYYQNQVKAEKLKQNEQIIDSLKLSLKIHKKKSDSLQIVATVMDNIIQNQEVKVVTVKEKFIVYKTAEMKNSSDAYKYLNNFIME